MKQQWPRLAYLGITNQMSSSERSRTYLLNIATIIAFISCWFYIIYNLLVSGNSWLIFSEVILSLLAVLVLVFNRRKQYLTAQILFFVALHAFIILVSFVISRGRMLEYMHFISIVMLLMFYGKSKLFYLLYVFNILLFYAPQLLFDVYPEENFSYVNPLVIFVSLFLITKYFYDDQKKCEVLLSEQNEKLKRLNEEKSQLISIAAHDLKSPLNRIQGLLSIVKLTSENLTTEQYELINKASEISQEQNNLIKKILDIDALENSNSKLHLRRENIIRILNNVVQDFEPIAQLKDIELQTSHETDKAYAYVDHTSMVHIYENLISNAVKFSPPNSNIYINSHIQNDMIRITIKDEGPGLKKEELPLLFQKFQKLSAQPTGGETSSGLGLSIAKKYVDAIRGNIWCESVPEQGATFYVEFKKA